jgi:hypothetical protein
MKTIHHIGFGKIKSYNLLKALRHNLREYEDELQGRTGIDPARIQFNVVLRGSGSALDLFRDFNRLSRAGCKRTIRKDSVLAVEALFTLPRGSGVDEQAYFTDSVNWFEAYSGGIVISAVIHNDEKEPHCHVLLLPLINGRMTGSKVMGNRPHLLEMKADHFKSVAAHYGIQLRKSLNYDEKQEAATKILAKLDADLSLLTQTNFRTEFIRAVSYSPHELINLLNIQLDEHPLPNQSFVSIMTSPGKGARYELDQ